MLRTVLLVASAGLAAGQMFGPMPTSESTPARGPRHAPHPRAARARVFATDTPR